MAMQYRRPKHSPGHLFSGLFPRAARGRRTAAVIDLKKHRALWEDIEDVLVSRSRRHEKRIPLEKVKANLIASGKFHG
jgi:phage baseplate assembly protein W